MMEETESSILTSIVYTPEGKLLFAALQNCFISASAQLYKIREHQSKGLIKPWDRLKSGGDSYGMTKIILRDDTAWIGSEDHYPVSLRYIADYLAYDSQGFIEKVRNSYRELLLCGSFLEIKTRFEL